MRTMVQAFTGGFGGPAAHSGDAIADRLCDIARRSDACAAIIGWNAGTPYDRVVGQLHRRGLKAYVWLPMFSEHGDNGAIDGSGGGSGSGGSGSARGPAPAIDFMGGRHVGATVGATVSGGGGGSGGDGDGDGSGGNIGGGGGGGSGGDGDGDGDGDGSGGNIGGGADDDFTFACPSDAANIRLAARKYDAHFSGCGFDGVFLDKIRFSSFGNGFLSGMGCFCQRCRDFYVGEGVDVGAFLAMMGQEDKSFLVPCARRGMRYSYSDPVVDSLCRARAKLIARSVGEAASAFRRRGLTVGLDVFAPALAYFVGQDIEALAGIADFIKPMAYRVTDSPAGIPYETRRMREELGSNGCQKIEGAIEALWDTDDLAGDDCFVEQLKELAGVKGLAGAQGLAGVAKELAGAPCEFYSGLEVNKVDVCAADAAYVERSLGAIEASGIAGCVLSWNVLADIVYPA